MARRNITAPGRDRPRERSPVTLFVSVLCAASIAASPAAAYHLEKKTQTVSVSSLKDFDKCQRDYESSGSDVCLDALKAYVAKHPWEAFDAGKRARHHFMHWVALDFFVKALDKRADKARCSDPDVAAAVISGLGLPPHYPAVDQARSLVDKTCAAQLQPVVLAELDGASGYFRTNACPLLTDSSSAAHCGVVRAKHEAPKVNAVAELKGVDWKSLRIDPESTGALRGTGGEELMFARSVPGEHEYVLLKFKNVRGPWNQQVIVAVERPSGIGRDYVTSVNGAEWVILTERQGHYQGFPKGVPDGLFLYPLQPTREAIKLPTRRQIQSEFATADPPDK